MVIAEPVRDARAEAEQRMDGEYHALVLEPSPPAVGAPWYADDPTDPGPLAGGDDRQVVSPVGNGDVTWDELCADDPALAEWCGARGLGGWRPLPVQLPAGYTGTRLALQSVAEHVACAARHAANGKIAMRYTLGGFGTPFFSAGGDTRQVRVELGRLVVQDGAALRRHDLTTLAAAAEAAGVPLGAPVDVVSASTPCDPSAVLDIDLPSAVLLGDWYALGASVLEQIRAESLAADPPSRVQLWPEHFDLGTDLGVEADGTRVTIGASPGDEANPQPYLYVLPWAEVSSGGFWNAESFRGAILAYAELVAAPDHREAALAFFRTGQELIDAH